MYGVKVKDDEPAVIISDHSKLQYYSTNSRGEKIDVTKEGIVEAVRDAIVGGKLKVRHSENIFERTARRLNKALEGLSDLFIAHPWRMTGLIVVGLGVFVWLITKVISDDVGGAGTLQNGSGSLKDKRRVD